MLPTYTPGDASRYAQSQGWTHKTSGEHIILRECPFCGKKDKLYWNDTTGAFDCKSAYCGKTGNYFTLRRDLGDPVPMPTAQQLQPQRPKAKRRTFAEFEPYEQNLLKDQAALDYLQKTRGLTLESIKKWHLGLKTENLEQHKIDGIDGPISWLMIPYITKQGDIADVKYRTLPPAPKRFKRLGGGESILYGEHLLPDKKAQCEKLFLCEGELDAITLDQHGFGPALSTTTGAASFSPRWYDLIVGSRAKKIVLLYDSDVDGQAAAEKLSKKFNDEEREVLNVVLDGCKDANEFFLKHSATDLKELIGETRPVEMEYVISMATVLDRLEEQIFMSGGAFNGIPSQFEALNKLIDGGYGNGYLVTILGGSGTGKTSFALQELVYMASAGLPTYMCCLEMPEEMVLRKVINHLYHLPLNAIKQEHIKNYRGDLERRHIYFGKGIRDLHILEQTFRKATKRYDLKAICFDNIHYLIRDTADVANQIGLVTRTLKDLATDLNIPILAIAQPNKFDRSERVITENDARGSASIEQDSDNMIMMWRPTLRTEIGDFGKTVGVKENMSPLTLFRVGKARYSPGGETLLYFHGDISTFRQLSEAEKDKLLGEVAEPEPQKSRGRR